MLTDTSMNSSSDGMSSSLKRRRLVSSAELVAERRSNTDLVRVGDEQVQSASTDAMILLHLQWGVTWLALGFLFSCSRRSGPGDVAELYELGTTCVFLVCLSSLLKGFAELTGHVHRT